MSHGPRHPTLRSQAQPSLWVCVASYAVAAGAGWIAMRARMSFFAIVGASGGGLRFLAAHGALAELSDGQRMAAVAGFGFLAHFGFWFLLGCLGGVGTHVAVSDATSDRSLGAVLKRAAPPATLFAVATTVASW